MSYVNTNVIVADSLAAVDTQDMPPS